MYDRREGEGKRYLSKAVAEFQIEFGEFILILDEIYSEVHKLKFMGIRVESKKSLRVLTALVDVLAVLRRP